VASFWPKSFSHRALGRRVGMSLPAMPPKRLPQVLGALGLLVAVGGVILDGLGLPSFDPWPARALVATCLLGLAGLMATGIAPELHRVGQRWIAVLSGLWMVMLLWGNAFASLYVPILIPALALGILAFDRSRSASLYLGGMSVLVVAAGWHTGEWEAGLSTALGSACTGAVLLGSLAQRSSLTHALVRHREELEADVAARTAELRREVVTRRAAEIRAMAASDAKSKFLANMSHELRTPLNAIIGYSELVREELADPDGSRDDARTDLRRVVRAADRLLKLVNDVLDLARIEADMMEILPGPMVLPDIVQEVCDEVRPLATGNGNEIVAELDASPTLMRSDEARVRQILVNLVTNAAKFTSDGRITVRVSGHEETVRVDVVDDGVGIAEEAMATLFDRFTQVDDSSTKVFGGTGLGLALSRDLARRMGGELFAKSLHGEGSTFTLLMPIDAESTAHLRAAAETSSDESSPMEGPTLRIVEAAGA